MKYNFFTWWLSVSIKPLPYKIWKYVITFIMFMLWVMFIAIYRDMYWILSLFVLLPTAVIDISWDAVNYHFYLKKQREKTTDDDAAPSEKDNQTN